MIKKGQHTLEIVESVRKRTFVQRLNKLTSKTLFYKEIVKMVKWIYEFRQIYYFFRKIYIYIKIIFFNINL